MRAAQVKYPNPFNPNVLSIDVISREIAPDGETLRTTKLFNSSWPMFSNAGELKAIESTTINPRKQYMLLESNNIDLRGVLKAYERLEYKVHPQNKEWTVVRHTVTVDAFSLVAYPALSVSKKNSKLGREALLWVAENRSDNFMSSVKQFNPLKVPLTPERLPTQPKRLGRPSSLSLLDCVKSLNLRGFVGPLVARAVSPEPRVHVPRASGSFAASTGGSIQSARSTPALLSVLSSFDLFNPSNLVDLRFSSVESRLEKVSSDVTALTEALRARCQRVAERLSKIDEYFLIM
ncbi:unnamed protein product [Schistocephalus solidus]|nr:unnamed protein product [Schistocephalus solidus]